MNVTAKTAPSGKRKVTCDDMIAMYIRLVTDCVTPEDYALHKAAFDELAFRIEVENQAASGGEHADA
jgi:hypothetical protein